MQEVSKNNAVAQIVDDFGKEYIKQSEEWNNFMLYIQTTCEDLMRGQVQVSVTSRVKTWKSLRKKLVRRHEATPYPTIEDIWDDQELDILGARVRTFFPKQLPVVCKIIEDYFVQVNTKHFASDWKNKDELPAYTEKFGNYEGTHYWVKLKENAGHPLPDSLWNRFKDQIFEIQVRSSMLLDGWAELRHDITYKAFGGKPSASERALLDSMKGVVKSMEILLDHLVDVHEDRVRSDQTEFETMPLFEQAVVRALPQVSLAGESKENVEILHTFLSTISLNSSGLLKEALRKSRFTAAFEDFDKQRVTSKHSVSTFILHHVFTTLPAESIQKLLDKIDRRGDKRCELRRVFCWALSYLEQNFFQQTNTQTPLTPDELERCNVIWCLHEYVTATEPAHHPERRVSSLLQRLFSTLKDSPLPRVDMALYLAVGNVLAGKIYSEEGQILAEILRNPAFMLCAQQQNWTTCGGNRKWWQLLREDHVIGSIVLGMHQFFPWHRHDSFMEHFQLDGETQKRSESRAAALLAIDTARLRSALLNRGFCQPDQKKLVAQIGPLLADLPNLNVNFTNHLRQTTLHIATIFHPPQSAPLQAHDPISLLLNAKDVNVNKTDHNGFTALIRAASRDDKHVKNAVLNHAGNKTKDLEKWDWKISHLAPESFTRYASLRGMNSYHEAFKVGGNNRGIQLTDGFAPLPGNVERFVRLEGEKYLQWS